MVSGDAPSSFDQAATALRNARAQGAAVLPFSDVDGHLDETWGYKVQALDRSYRLAAGERVVGAKLGLTSEAKQRRMSVDRPIAGFLTDVMLMSEDSIAHRLSRWIQPRIEPEIAFTTARSIAEPLDLAGVVDVVAGVAVAAEIIDSRFVDYRFRLPDVLADNTSAAGVLLGPLQSRKDLNDLSALKCTVSVDGHQVHEATGAAILGNPLLALVWLSEHLASRGEVLPAGSLVLAGALTDAVPLRTRTNYRLEIEGLGAIDVRT